MNQNTRASRARPADLPRVRRPGRPVAQRNRPRHEAQPAVRPSRFPAPPSAPREAEPPVQALVHYGACAARRHGEMAAGLERMAGWRYNVLVSVARVLAMMATDEREETPAQAVARWFRGNCRGGWEVFPVPGVGLVACMDDGRCAERFAPAFGIDNRRGRIELED